MRLFALREHLNKCEFAWHAKFASLPAMKTSFPWKATVLLFVAVALAYLAVFNGIEYARKRKGPWEVEFTATSEGRPLLLITQAYSRVFTVLEFPDEKVN